MRVRYAQKLTVPHACILRHVLRHDRIVSLAGPSPHHAGDGGIRSASAERAAEPLSPPCIPPLSPLARHCSEWMTRRRSQLPIARGKLRSCAVPALPTPNIADMIERNALARSRRRLQAAARPLTHQLRCCLCSCGSESALAPLDGPVEYILLIFSISDFRLQDSEPRARPPYKNHGHARERTYFSRFRLPASTSKLLKT